MSSLTAADVPKISLLGTAAALLEAPGGFDLSQQQRIWALADVVSRWPHVLEAVPGVTNLMVAWREAPRDEQASRAELLAAWASVQPKDVSGRLVEIPVVYGGAAAVDLAAVEAYTGVSRRELIAIHSGTDYTVCAVGAAPGFAYLHGLDPRLFCPRKSVPAMHVPAGAVTIGGMQTGVSATTGPNGWHVIGHADVAMFDLSRDPPSLLRAGDRIRFVVERIDP